MMVWLVIVYDDIGSEIRTIEIFASKENAIAYRNSLREEYRSRNEEPPVITVHVKQVR